MQIAARPYVATPATRVRVVSLGDAYRRDQSMINGLRAGCQLTEITPWPSVFRSQERALFAAGEIILADLSTCSSQIVERFETLNAAIGISDIQPRLLCFSTQHRNPQFVMRVQQCGARYVRVANPAMLLEAINLLAEEMRELHRNGPSFQIVHGFSEGSCMPGEEISAVLLSVGSESLQLPLGLAQRFVFEFLARRRRLALDSLQIVSGISGDWFFKEHAAKSGHRQIKKIRRATVKVLIQRIRDAMTITFAKANLKFDPGDVLRSCRAEGSTRALYKLHADILWRHTR